MVDPVGKLLEEYNGFRDQYFLQEPDLLAQLAAQGRTRRWLWWPAVIRDSVNNLLTFPWIKQRIDANALQLHDWFRHRDR